MVLVSQDNNYIINFENTPYIVKYKDISGKYIIACYVSDGRLTLAEYSSEKDVNNVFDDLLNAMRLNKMFKFLTPYNQESFLEELKREKGCERIIDAATSGIFSFLFLRGDFNAYKENKS